MYDTTWNQKGFEQGIFLFKKVGPIKKGHNHFKNIKFIGIENMNLLSEILYTVQSPIAVIFYEILEVIILIAILMYCQYE